MSILIGQGGSSPTLLTPNSVFTINNGINLNPNEIGSNVLKPDNTNTTITEVESTINTNNLVIKKP